MIEPKTPGPNAHPEAYIRRSVSRAGDAGDISREFQVQEVSRLAGEDAALLVIIDQDWGISAAREKTYRRLAFLAMLERIERGEVSTLYAYAADRLARSVRWATQLLDACEDAGTTIVTREGRFPPGDSAARMMFQVLAMANENAVRGMSDKARSTIAVRQRRGDYLGNPPYGSRVVGGKLVPRPDEDVAVVVDAYRRAGGIQSTARLLNSEGHHARNGRPWWASAVRSVLEAQAPDILPPKVAGRRQLASYRLSGLLRCPHDGALLGGKPARSKAAYRCRLSLVQPDHPHPAQVSEAQVMPWVKAQVARFRMPATVGTETAEAEAKRAELEAKRELVIDAYVDRKIDKVGRDRRLEAIDKELQRVGSVTAVIAMPAIDWDWPAADVNLMLRRFFTAIKLGPDMRPVGFESDIPAEWWA